MNAQLKDPIDSASSSADLIASANLRITKGLMYGDDMASSRDLCFADATLLIELALDKDEAFWVQMRAFMTATETLIYNSYNGGGLECNWAVQLTAEEGKRYIRIVKGTAILNKDGSITGSYGRHAFCFIDKTNGDVLKAAGWKAPAKHARGNIYSASAGVDGVTAYGAKYL